MENSGVLQNDIYFLVNIEITIYNVYRYEIEYLIMTCSFNVLQTYLKTIHTNEIDKTFLYSKVWKKKFRD